MKNSVVLYLNENLTTLFIPFLSSIIQLCHVCNMSSHPPFTRKSTIRSSFWRRVRPSAESGSLNCFQSSSPTVTYYLVLKSFLVTRYFNVGVVSYFSSVCPVRADIPLVTIVRTLFYSNDIPKHSYTILGSFTIDEAVLMMLLK